jgi:predicted transcriptional regulator
MRDPKYQPLRIKKMVSNNNPNKQEMAAGIVAAYVGNNPMPAVKMPELIKSVYDVLAALEESGNSAKPVKKPAVAPAKSVGREFVVCLEDGLRFKSMKRHLKVAHGMSPEAYRAKWRLSKDHPIVAPAYSQRRSTIAKQAKFGQQIKLKSRRAAKAAGQSGRDLKKAA